MKRILIIGDSCQDIFVYCTCKRLAPEFPVQVLDESHKTLNGGMAKNVEANILSLGINCDIITNNNWQSITKTRYVDRDSNYMFIRVDSNYKIDSCNVDIDSINWDKYDAVIVSDYDKGFISAEDINSICKNHSCVFLDTKKRLGTWAELAKFIRINYVEYTNSKDIIDKNKVLSNKVIYTKGAEGVYYQGKHYNVKPVEVKDVSGAGDSFLAGLVTEYINTSNIEKSITFANECASEAVKHKGVTGGLK